MGEKKQKSHQCDHKKKTSNGGDGAKKEILKSSVTVLLKVEMHCEGCASKIAKCVKGFEGVDSVKTEWETNKLTVVGKVDPAKIRDKLAEKTKKKVDLVSSHNKDAKSSDKKTDDKKPKEAPVTTAVLKLSLHCQGCIEKIHRVLGKTNGVHEKCIDRQKDLLTVKGTMNANALVESLKKSLKRAVEIVPPKKDGGEKKDGGGGEGGKKGKGGGGEKKENGGGGAPRMAEDRVGYVAAPTFIYTPVEGYSYGYGQPNPYPDSYPHGSGYGNPVPGQQMFSDENPNACSVM